MSDERCETCRFWAESTECRRHPPVAVRTPDDEDVYFISAWPTSHEHDWCGEYDKRLEPLTDDEWALVDLMDPVAGADLLLRRRVRGVVDVRPKEKA